jgi:hypothetical protein
VVIGQGDTDGLISVPFVRPSHHLGDEPALAHRDGGLLAGLIDDGRPLLLVPAPQTVA